MTMLTGHQWGDDGAYIGPYEFHNNADQEAVHLPPRTTLTPPPEGIAPGYEAAWDAAQENWVVRIEDLGWMAAERIGA